VLVGAGVAVVAGAGGFAWYAVTKPGTRVTTPSSTPGGTPTALATVAEIPEGGGVILESQNVVLTRETGDKVHAFSAVCTHQGCIVNQVANGQISCPCHGSVFNANTGAVETGPAQAPLPAVPVTVVNGSVYTG
jgi:Rieske Fe-S protein